MSGLAWIPPHCRCGELATSRAAGCDEWMCGACSDRWIEEHPAEFRRAMDERHGRCPECRCAQGHTMECSRGRKARS